ncbi:MAG: NADH-quinone oxidoreductase subunit J [Halieaceae bacterium]|jgi:NADH-quinone oxidoreductase subunit J|nr:NADH-quinone oxidoreductase subunit J [Halieaceae bacterium]
MEAFTFYLTSAVTIVAMIMVISRTNPVHSMMYLVVSSISMAVIFYILGAPFAAALEILVYAGAILVLFVFAIMMLNLGHESVEQERSLLTPGIWTGPSMLSVILLGVLGFIITGESPQSPATSVSPKEVGVALYGPYLLAVELGSMLLMAGLIGAYHLGRPLLKKD